MSGTFRTLLQHRVGFGRDACATGETIISGLGDAIARKVFGFLRKSH